MADAKSKFFQRISPALCVLALLIPSIWQTPHLWQFDKGLLVGPYNADIFSLSFRLIKNYRIVLSPYLAPFLSLAYTYLGPALLILAFYLFRILFQGRARNVLALFAASGLLHFSFAGTSPEIIGQWIGSLLLISSILWVQNVVKFWVITFAGILVAVSSENAALLVLWTTGVIILTGLIHFFLVERTAIQWKARQIIGPSSLQIMAWTLLTSTALLIVLALLPQDLRLRPSHTAWMAWIAVGLSILLTWLQPWQSRLWLYTSTFPWILYFTPLAEKPVEVLIGVLTIKVFQVLLKDAEIFWKYTRSFLLCGALAIIGASAIRFVPPTRTFDLEWVNAVNELPHFSPKNMLVLSESNSFISQLFKTNIIFDPNAMLITEEPKLLKWMADNGVSHVVIERDYFLSFWKKWLSTDQPADISNKSVISRILWYRGEQLNTATLKAPKVDSLILSELKSTDHFVIISKK